MSSRRNSQGTRQGADQTFTCSPQVSTFNPFDVTAFSATLNGEVNPNGLATTAQLSVGPDQQLRQRDAACSLSGAGTTFDVHRRRQLYGPALRHAYHFRATATNANGTSFGNDVIFSTASCAPSAHTGVATLVGHDERLVVRRDNPERHGDERALRMGRDDGVWQLDAGPVDGFGPRSSSRWRPAAISGLTCNTTYHFRTVATNSFGSSTGSDRAFVTAPCVMGAFKGIVYALNQFPFTNLIYGYGVKGTGALEQLPGFPMPTGGAGDDENEGSEQLTYDSATSRLYAINIMTNTLSAFSVNPRTGALTPMPYQPDPAAAGRLVDCSRASERIPRWARRR